VKSPTHLFDDDQQIREELESVTLHPHVGLQRLIARVAPDSDVGRTEIAPVSLVQLKATRLEDEKKGTLWDRARAPAGVRPDEPGDARVRDRPLRFGRAADV